jgi:phosphopentomutase
MLEEKNDNLQDADGIELNETSLSTTAENQEITTEVPVTNDETPTEEVPSQVEVSPEEAVVEVEAPLEEVVAEVETPTEEVEVEVPIEEVVAEVETPIEEAVVETPIEEVITQEEAPTEELVAEVEMAIESVGTDNTSHAAISAIEEVNAEESEDESLKERHDIPMLDYETLSMEQLVDELSELVVVEKVMSVKDHVEELKKAFLSKY